MKFLHLLKSATFFCGVCIAMCACSDNETAPIEVEEKAEIIIDEAILSAGIMTSSEPKDYSFTFTTNTDWVLNIETDNNSNWCTSNYTMGNAGMITTWFTIKENLNYESRIAYVTIQAGDISKTFKITQQQKNAILLSQEELNVSSKGDTIDVILSSNVNVEIITPDWITEYNQSRGLTEEKKSFLISANLNANTRKGEIIFKNTANNISNHLKINQEYEILSHYEISVDSAGTLSNKINKDIMYKIISLKINGELNGTDILFLRYMAGCGDTGSRKTDGKLESLDLSGSKIVKGGDYYYWDYDYSTGGFKSYYTNDNTIDDNMFAYCNSLKHFKFPQDITSIGCNAFFECSLDDTSLVIPEGVTSIGDEAFSGWEKLGSITLPKTLVSLSGFGGCSSLTSITIPDNVTTIGNGAFASCNSLTSITIPDGVTTIGNDAFASCNNLTSITFPIGATIINDGTFAGCDNLISFTIPINVTKIGDNAFSGCNGLTSFTIPEGVISIGNSAFAYCNGLKSIIIPNSVTSIDNCAFMDCIGLETIILSGRITSISPHTFSGCTNLKSVKLPNGLISVGIDAFYNCKELTDIKLPNSITTIDERAFYNCI